MDRSARWNVAKGCLSLLYNILFDDQDDLSVTTNGGLVDDRQWGACRGFNGHGGPVGDGPGWACR